MPTTFFAVRPGPKHVLALERTDEKRPGRFKRQHDRGNFGPRDDRWKNRPDVGDEEVERHDRNAGIVDQCGDRSKRRFGSIEELLMLVEIADIADHRGGVPAAWR